MGLYDSDVGPGGASWPAAVLRALLPTRWGLCALGLAASIGLAAALADLNVQGLAHDPPAEMLRLGQGLFPEILVSTSLVWDSFRGALLVVLLAGAWGLVGGWIIRSELLRQRGSDEPVQTSATLLVARRVSALCTPCCMILIFVVILQVPLWVAGLVNYVLGWGVGAVLVALLLPVLLVAAFLVVLVKVGLLAFGLMPATIAAEGTDGFDALSRSYSYFFQAPLQFAVWAGLALAVASLPLLGMYGLTEAGPPPFGRDAQPYVWLAAGALSLSLFWSLQGLVYLKLRRVVDNTAEIEIWDGPIGDAVHPKPAADTAAKPDATAQEDKPAEGDATSDDVCVKRARLTFGDTIRYKAMSPSFQLALFLGMLWAALVLVGGARLAAGQAPAPPKDRSVESVHTAILELADDRPITLIGFALATVLLGAVGLAGPLLMTARNAAVRTVYDESLTLRAAMPIVGYTWRRGWAGILCATVGIDLLLIACALVPLALEEAGGWVEVAAAAFPGIGLLGLGAVALGAATVEPAGWPGTVAALHDHGTETLASAVVNVCTVPLHSLLVFGLAALTWLITCEAVSRWGLENASWLRWGLDGSLWPTAEGVLYKLAAGIAGVWFLLLAGCVCAYPVACALSWGAVSHLRARQHPEGMPQAPIGLTDEEREALLQRKKSRRKQREKLASQKERLAQRKAGGAATALDEATSAEAPPDAPNY
jgi:hypothetical protein